MEMTTAPSNDGGVESGGRAGPAMSVRGINVDYRTRPRTRAVSGVSFDLGIGSSLSIVGESGSGKSSVVRAIGGLLLGKADVTWDELTIQGEHAAPNELTRGVAPGSGRLLSYVFQEPKSCLNPSLRIGTQLTEVLRLHLGLDRGNAREEAVKLLSEVGIPDGERRLNNYVHQLSGGLAQRVAIAMAIAPKPAILIADEPTSSLDVTVAARVIGLIRRLQAARGMALIHVTHSLHLAAKSSDRILVMYAGQVVEEGVAGEVLLSPQMPYTKALLAAAPKADGTGGLTPISGSPPDLRFASLGCRFQERCVHAQDGCSTEIPLRETTADRLVRCRRVAELNEIVPAGAANA
jgi:peptide/nickel transport system permease protein